MAKHLLFLFLFLLSVSAHSQAWQWVAQAGGNYTESSQIAVDAEGNSYATGNFVKTATFGNTVLTGSDNGNSYVVKHDAAGQLVWATHISSSLIAESMDIAVDAAQNSYITGSFAGTLTIGSYAFTSLEVRAAFIAKLDANGNVVWAKQGTSTEGNVEGSNVTVDANGNVFVTGDFFKAVTFGSTTLNATKDEQIYILKYSPTGDLAWARMAGGLGSSHTYDIATDGSGNLYLTGEFWLTAAFGNITLFKNDAITTPGEIFVAKYDASGNALWARQAGGAGSDEAIGIAVDGNGNCYITGAFQGSATFGYTSLSGGPGMNMFLAKYNASGDLFLLKKITGTGDVVGTGIGLDAAGNIYTTGFFKGTASFGNATLISYGEYDMFFARFDANGTVTGAMQAGGSGLDLAKGMGVNANGQVYFTGKFDAPARFGDVTLSEKVVIGKINAISYNQEPAPTISLGDVSTSILCAGETLDVPFTTTGRFGDDNVFTVQLSNASGSFSYPKEIGSGTASPVRATVPTDGAIGAGYRIQVVASSPKVQSAANDQSLTVSKPPVVTVAAASTIIVAGASTTLYASGADTYEWSPATGLSNAQVANPVAMPSATTTYTVTGTKGGCSSSATVKVRVEPVPAPGSAYTWASVKYGGAIRESEAVATATDAEGNLYVGGYFAEKITFGDVTLEVPGYAGYDQIFIVKYNPAGEVKWAKAVGGIQNDRLADLAVDKQGNLYITGWFDPAITIGNQTFPATEGIDYFVAKFNKDGEPEWANHVKGPNNEVMAIAAGPNGEVYLAGTYRNSVTFNGITLESGVSLRNYFLVKYNPEGKEEWAESFDGTSEKGYRPMDLATDSKGNVYATGCFSKGTLFIGSTTLTSSNEFTDSFIAKYSPDGQASWAKLLGQSVDKHGHTTSSHISIDTNDRIYAAGAANQYTQYDNVTFGDYGVSGNYLARFNTEGNLVWVTGAAGGISIDGLTTDTEGFVYITGDFTSTAAFGTKRFATASTEYAIYVAKYDVLGNAVWAETAKANQFWDVMSKGISVDHNQNIYLTGVFDRSGMHDPVSFGCHTIQSNISGLGHYYIAKLSPLSGEIPSITTGSLTSAEVCAGATIEVPFTVSGSNTACASYTVLLSDAQGSFQNAKIIGTGAASPIMATLPANTAAGNGYRVKVIGAAPAITGSDNSANITVTALPVVYISASKTAPCPGTEGVTYTASSASTQITSYLWSVPADWVITEGQGTNRIKVTAGVAAGEVTVVVGNACGTEVTKSMAAAPANVYAPTVLFKEKDICGADNTVFTASGAPYGATYRWYDATGAEPIWEDRPYGSESRFYTPVVDENTTFYVSLLFNSGCESERVPLTVTMKAIPAKPGPITVAALEICVGSEATYQVAEVSGALGYNWQVPYGWEILSGQGKAAIRVRQNATAGEVHVAAYNGCGSSPTQSLAVQPGVPVSPTTYSGTKCGPNSFALIATGAPAGGLYRWYTAATGGEPVATGELLVTPVLEESTTYYAAYVTASGCESVRTATTAVVKPMPVVAAGPAETVCAGQQGFLLKGAEPAGGTWSGRGVTAQGYFNPASVGVGTFELTYSVSQNGCTATATKTITVTQAPEVTLAAFADVCSDIRDYVLTGGWPAGGVYSGVGVENGLFTPVDTIGQYNISYTYTGTNGCATSVSQLLTVTTCTGLPESSLASKLILYPNPTQAETQVELALPKATNLTMRLFDAKGQKMYEQQYTKAQGNFKQVLHLSSKPKGVYMLQLILDDGVITRRVIKD